MPGQPGDFEMRRSQSGGGNPTHWKLLAAGEQIAVSPSEMEGLDIKLLRPALRPQTQPDLLKIGGLHWHHLLLLKGDPQQGI